MAQHRSPRRSGSSVARECRGPLAALAMGATVAGGQVTVGDPAHERVGFEKVASSAVLPVVGIGRGAVNAEVDLDPVGAGRGEPSGSGTAPEALDVGQLVKAVEVGNRLADEAIAIRRALVNGAPAASVFAGRPFAQPVEGTVTSNYGGRWGTTHYGLDIANTVGTPVFAVTDGTVVDSGPASGFGLWVRVRDRDGYTTVYGHINQTFVRAGQQVRAGEVIAEVGDRGQSTGPHLHFEVRDAAGNRLDPAAWLSRRGVAQPGAA